VEEGPIDRRAPWTDQGHEEDWCLLEKLVRSLKTAVAHFSSTSVDKTNSANGATKQTAQTAQQNEQRKRRNETAQTAQRNGVCTSIATPRTQSLRL